jgi:hypothetical protein
MGARCSEPLRLIEEMVSGRPGERDGNENVKRRWTRALNDVLGQIARREMARATEDAMGEAAPRAMCHAPGRVDGRQQRGDDRVADRAAGGLGDLQPRTSCATRRGRRVADRGAGGAGERPFGPRGVRPRRAPCKRGTRPRPAKFLRQGQRPASRGGPRPGEAVSPADDAGTDTHPLAHDLQRVARGGTAPPASPASPSAVPRRPSLPGTTENAPATSRGN